MVAGGADVARFLAAGVAVTAVAAAAAVPPNHAYDRRCPFLNEDCEERRKPHEVGRFGVLSYGGLRSTRSKTPCAVDESGPVHILLLMPRCKQGKTRWEG